MTFSIFCIFLIFYVYNYKYIYICIYYYFKYIFLYVVGHSLASVFLYLRFCFGRAAGIQPPPRAPRAQRRGHWHWRCRCIGECGGQLTARQVPSSGFDCFGRTTDLGAALFCWRLRTETPALVSGWFRLCGRPKIYRHEWFRLCSRAQIYRHGWFRLLTRS